MRFEVGGVQTYPVAVLAAILVGVSLSVFRLRRAGFAGWNVVAAQVGLGVAGLVGARAYALIEGGGSLGSLLHRGGLRYPGGIIAATTVLILAAAVSRKFRWIAACGDAAAPAVALSMAVVRVGCLLHGCCYGQASTLPWALRFPAHSPPWNDQVTAGLLAADSPASLPVHPLQLYFGCWSLAIFVLLLALERRKRYSGQLALLFLALQEGGKALMEFVRAPEPIWHLQVASGALAASAVAFLSGTAAMSTWRVRNARVLVRRPLP